MPTPGRKPHESKKKKKGGKCINPQTNAVAERGSIEGKNFDPSSRFDAIYDDYNSQVAFTEKVDPNLYDLKTACFNADKEKSYHTEKEKFYEELLKVLTFFTHVNNLVSFRTECVLYLDHNDTVADLSWDIAYRLYKEEREFIAHHQRLTCPVLYQHFIANYRRHVGMISPVQQASEATAHSSMCTMTLLIESNAYPKGLFPLNTIEKFLRFWIPDKILLPDSEHGLVELWLWFSYSTLIPLVKTIPIQSRFEALKNQIQLGDPDYFSYPKSLATPHGEETLIALEKELDEINNRLLTENNNPLTLYNKSNAERVSLLEDELNLWKNSLYHVENPDNLTSNYLSLLIFLLHLSETNTIILRNKIIETMGKDFSEMPWPGSTCKTHAASNSINALYYFYRWSFTKDNLINLHTMIRFLFFSEMSSANQDIKTEHPMTTTQLNIGDVALVGRCISDILNKTAQALNLKHLEARTLLSKLQTLDTWLTSRKQSIAQEATALTKKITVLTHEKKAKEKKLISTIDEELSAAKNIRDEVMMIQHKAKGVSDVLKEFATLTEAGANILATVKAFTKLKRVKSTEAIHVSWLTERIQYFKNQQDEYFNFIVAYEALFAYEENRIDVHLSRKQSEQFLAQAKNADNSDLTKKNNFKQNILDPFLKKSFNYVNNLTRQLQQCSTYLTRFQSEKNDKQARHQFSSAVGQVSGLIQCIINCLNALEQSNALTHNLSGTKILDYQTTNFIEIVDQMRSLNTASDVDRKVKNTRSLALKATAAEWVTLKKNISDVLHEIVGPDEQCEKTLTQLLASGHIKFLSCVPELLDRKEKLFTQYTILSYRPTTLQESVQLILQFLKNETDNIRPTPTKTRCTNKEKTKKDSDSEQAKLTATVTHTAKRVAQKIERKSDARLPKLESHAHDLFTAYVAAMNNYNQHVVRCKRKQDNLAAQVTQLIQNNTPRMTPEQAVEHGFSIPTFSDQYKKFKQAEVDVLKTWNDKETIKAKFRNTLHDTATFTDYVARIDPVGLAEQTPPIVVASLNAMRTVYITPCVIDYIPVPATLFVPTLAPIGPSRPVHFFKHTPPPNHPTESKPYFSNSP